MMFVGVLLSTHLLFKDSQQKKRLITCFDLQLPTAVESKLSELCSCILISFLEQICVTKTKSQCSRNFLTKASEQHKGRLLVVVSFFRLFPTRFVSY